MQTVSLEANLHEISKPVFEETIEAFIIFFESWIYPRVVKVKQDLIGIIMIIHLSCYLFHEDNSLTRTCHIRVSCCLLYDLRVSFAECFV